MIKDKKIVVVMPAYNARKTLEKTLSEIDRAIVDHIILVDDSSQDQTYELAMSLQLDCTRHDINMGYGGNQKTCYAKALACGADIVIMIHPDYQYTPKLIPVAAGLVASGIFDIALGSRILSGGALRGGMPFYKYVSNRILTVIQNCGTGMKLSEYHTGYRAFTREVLESLPLDANSSDFIFDNQILLQAHLAGFRVGEFSCPAAYFPEASSINLKRSAIYGFGCLWNTVLYLMAVTGIFQAPIFRGIKKRPAASDRGNHYP